MDVDVPDRVFIDVQNWTNTLWPFGLSKKKPEVEVALAPPTLITKRQLDGNKDGQTLMLGPPTCQSKTML